MNQSQAQQSAARPVQGWRPSGANRQGWAAMALLVAAAAAPARAEIVDLVWTDAGRFERALTVPAGKFAEVCGPLDAGAQVNWRFEASAPLNFNIHYHVGQEIRYPERRDALARGEGQLRAQLRQDYCWMWTNKGAQPARLSLVLSR